MDGITASAFAQAWHLIWTLSPGLTEILGLSLAVSFSAVAIACAIGFPLGAALAIGQFPGRAAIGVTLSAMMGLPPVVVGLTLYLLLSASGPLGPLGLLYSVPAMVAAQAILVTPIVAALTRQVVEDLHVEYDEMLRAMHASRLQAIATLLWDARLALVTAALAGFGRASAEVGAVMIVGGNINHVTRTMTTAIATETARGELALALALGIVLLAITFAVNLALMSARSGVNGHARA